LLTSSQIASPLISSAQQTAQYRWRESLCLLLFNQFSSRKIAMKLPGGFPHSQPFSCAFSPFLLLEQFLLAGNIAAITFATHLFSGLLRSRGKWTRPSA
jgi:hypothetical protein